MLHLFNKKSKKIIINKEITPSFILDIESQKKSNRFGENKHYPPAIKEWFNSIYVYNKNYFFKSLPITDKIVNKLIKNYFNLNSDKYKKLKRLSVKKIFTSRAEIKHTNKKVIITVYTYNRQKLYFLNKISKIIFKFILINKFKSTNNIPNHVSKKNKKSFTDKLKVNINKYKYEKLIYLKVKKVIDILNFNINRYKHEKIIYLKVKRLIDIYKYKIMSLKFKLLLEKLKIKFLKINKINNKIIKKNYYAITSIKKNIAMQKNKINNDTHYVPFATLQCEEDKNLLTQKNIKKLKKNAYGTDKSKKNKNLLIKKIYNNIARNIYGFNFISYIRIKKTNESLNKKLYNIFLDIKYLIIKIKKKNKTIFKNLNWKKDKFEKYKNQYIKFFISLLLKKEFKNVVLCQYLITILYLNDYKFKSKNILALKSIISKIYNKKVELNIVNLKYLHLNTDIFSESISKKLKNRGNRLLKVLKRALNLVKLPYFIKYFEDSVILDLHMRESKFYNKNLENNLDVSDINGDLSINKEVIHEPFSKKNHVLGFIKYKTINGVRLEGTGRLTKRLTASRSIFKFRYKGGLKDVDSSYKKKSAIILRGHIKSNVQYTNINSKTRNGSFGLKNWISSY